MRNEKPSCLRNTFKESPRVQVAEMAYYSLEKARKFEQSKRLKLRSRGTA